MTTLSADDLRRDLDFQPEGFAASTALGAANLLVSVDAEREAALIQLSRSQRMKPTVDDTGRWTLRPAAEIDGAHPYAMEPANV